MAEFVTIKAPELPTTSVFETGDFVMVIRQGKLNIMPYSDFIPLISTPSSGSLIVSTYTLQDGDTFEIEGGARLHEIIVFSETEQTFSLGTTEGGTELIDGEEITDSEPVINTYGKYYPTTTTIHVSSESELTIHVVKLIL